MPPTPKAAAQQRIVRQWTLVQELSRHRRGLTARQIVERTEISKASVHRYLQQLEQAGVPIGREAINGEVRYSLDQAALPALGPSALQIAALRLARRSLGSLAGTRAARELDALLASYPHADEGLAAVSLAPRRAVQPELARKLDAAIAGVRRTRIRYRSANAALPAWRLVDPVGLREVRGQVYFVAHDKQRSCFVPFKLDRISAVDVLPDRADKHALDLDEFFRHARTAWTAAKPTEVAVRLAPHVARFVHEYPLIEAQTLEDRPDGSIVVRAQVNGIEEALRWVLGWGGDAEALEPRALRSAAAAQLASALARYDAAGPASTGGKHARTGAVARTVSARRPAPPTTAAARRGS